MKYCNVCGFENYDDAKFCQKCGNNIAEAQIQGEAVVTEAIVTKSNKIGMIFGIVALGLILPCLSVSSIGRMLFDSTFNSSVFSSVACSVIFSAMTIISSIGLGKSIRDKNSVGKILNPIALGIGSLFFTIYFNQLLELFS